MKTRESVEVDTVAEDWSEKVYITRHKFAREYQTHPTLDEAIKSAEQDVRLGYGEVQVYERTDRLVCYKRQKLNTI